MLPLPHTLSATTHHASRPTSHLGTALATAPAVHERRAGMMANRALMTEQCPLLHPGGPVLFLPFILPLPVPFLYGEGVLVGRGDMCSFSGWAFRA